MDSKQQPNPPPTFFSLLWKSWFEFIFWGGVSSTKMMWETLWTVVFLLTNGKFCYEDNKQTRKSTRPLSTSIPEVILTTALPWELTSGKGWTYGLLCTSSVGSEQQLNIMPFYVSKSRQSCHSRSKISLLCAKQGERVNGVPVGYKLHLAGWAQGKNGPLHGTASQCVWGRVIHASASPASW